MTGTQSFTRADNAERAIASGYDAFAITVDVALNSRRDRHIADRASRGPGSVGGSAGMAHQAAFNWSDVERFKQKFRAFELANQLAHSTAWYFQRRICSDFRWAEFVA